MVAISYDPLDKVEAFAKKKGISFPLLSDESQSVLRRFGLRTKEGFSIPGTYLVGQDGRVLAEFFKAGYKKRHTSKDFIKAARREHSSLKQRK